MRKLLVTIATPDILPLCKEILETHSHYAGKQKFDFTVADIHWKDIHPSFSKVWEIHKALEEGYDFIIWADADVAFMDSSYEFLKLLEPDYFVAAYHQINWKSWRYLCNGLIIIRNTPTTKVFVKEWIRRVETQFMKDHPFEQWYFDEMMRERNYDGIRPCEANEIGCFAPEIWHDGNIWQQGMPSVHLGGPADWQRRQQVFIQHYQNLVK